MIDTHLHVYDLKLKASFPNQNWTIVDFPDPVNEKAIAMDTTQEYAKEIANKSGVKKVVMVMCFDDCPEETQWVYDNAQKVDLIIGIVAGLDLTKHEKLLKFINEFRTNFKRPKFVGIRHHLHHPTPSYNTELLFSQAFQQGLGILEKENVPLDLNIDLRTNPDILKHFVDIAKKFPNLKMVVDHLGKPDVPKGQDYLENWKADITELAKHPNVYMKLSGMVVLAAETWSKEIFQPYIDHCIKEFGVKRCMFGSDWPVCRLATNADYGDVLQLLQEATKHLSFEERKAIFRENAINYYGLDEE